MFKITHEVKVEVKVVVVVEALTDLVGWLRGQEQTKIDSLRDELRAATDTLKISTDELQQAINDEHQAVK